VRPAAKADAELGALFERCRGIVEDVSLGEVARWKASHPGSRAVGLFPVYTPAELLLACGVLPVGLHGAGGRVEIDRADSRIQSFVCSITRSTLELGLAGHLAPLDGVIFPSICDAARNLSGVFQRNFPGLLVEYLHLPSNAASAAALPYYRGELGRVLTKLAALAGRTPTREDLARAIALCDEHRSLVDRLYEARRDEPWRLSAVECALLVRAGSLLPREEHVALLRSALERLPERTARRRDRIRVLLHGSFCEQPPLELLETLEEAGCYVVDDDLLLGTRWILGPVAAAGDPLEDLARAYLQRSRPAAVRHGTVEPKGRAILDLAERAGADGVVFATAKFCEPALFDLVPEKRALDQAGFPNLAFEFEEKMGTFESIRTQVETFVESILLFADERAAAGPKPGGRR
jgi:benzoyl-CoA reductase subunit C